MFSSSACKDSLNLISDLSEKMSRTDQMKLVDGVLNKLLISVPNTLIRKMSQTYGKLVRETHLRYVTWLTQPSIYWLQIIEIKALKFIAAG